LELDLAGLRERLTRQAPPAFSAYRDEGFDWDDAAAVAKATAAAVLVPVVTHQSGLTVLLTQRTAHLKAHSGQVAFPGGRAEPGDASPEFTALREAQEEIGLAPERVEILARMPDYFTRTGFRVTPVVGLVAPPLELAPDPNEVQDVFEVPLSFLLDPANHHRRTRELLGKTVGFYEMPYKTKEGERYIWGVTAGMIVNLYRLLSA
jgi:8-oxo-dGTP pyrophosphatase MutT (NUDIX family)